METEHKTVKRRGFFFYLTVLGVILAVILAALLVRHRYDSLRWEADPARIMSEYMQQQFAADLDDAIDSYSQSKAAEYQSAGEIATELSSRFPAEGWMVGIASDRPDGREYPLYYRDEEMGRIILLSDDGGLFRFGMDQWHRPSAEFDFNKLARTVTIIAPYGCGVYVNDVLLSEDLVTETAGLYPQLLEHELLIPEANQLMVYVLEGVVIEPAVEFDKGYTLLRDDTGDTYYALPECSAVLGDEMVDYCGQFIRAYVNFTLNKKSLWALQQFAVPKGPFYKSLTQASLGLDWNNGINAKVEKVEIREFRYFGNAITCRAVYKMTTDTGDRTDAADLLLVETKKGWRIAAIES